MARSDTAHEAHRVRIHNMRSQREGLITHITSAAAGRGVLPDMGL